MDVDSEYWPQYHTESHPTKPLFLDFRSSRAFILIVVIVAVFTDTFFYTLVIPILPNLLEVRAGISPSQAQKWTSIMLSIYALTNLITSPIAGFISDRSKSRRPALLGGIIAMAVSTTLFAFGRTPVLLLVARALQGASAAVIRVGGLALITDTFGVGKSGSALGWQSVGMFVGTFAGPSVSGFLYDYLGHFAVFGAAYLILVIDIVLRLTMIERKEAMEWEQGEDETEEGEGEYASLLPVSQESRLESGLGHSSQEHHTTDNGIHQTLCTTSLSLSSPIFILLRNRRLLTALWATFSCAVIMTALESVIPLYTMQLFGWTPSQTGLLIIALSVSIIADPWLGSLADKYGCRWFSTFGFLLIVAVYMAISTITHNIRSDMIKAYVLLVILGFAIGLIATPTMVEVSLLVSAAEKDGSLGGFRADQVMGQAYGAMNVAYQIGSLAGPVWGGFLLVGHGWGPMCGSFAVLAGIGSLIMALFAEHFGETRRDRYGLRSKMGWKAPEKLREKAIPMRVLNFGMSRTGTTSMCAALQKLGCVSCYHLDYDSDDCAFWLAAMEAKYEGKGTRFGKAEWDHIFSEYDAISDLPAILFASDLVSAYPEAKILLTVRDVDSWQKSMMATVCNPVYRNWYHRLPALVFPKEQALCDMSDKCEQIAWKNDCERYGRSFYMEYNEMIRSLVPSEVEKPLGERRFLEWQLGEGWERLAMFLNHKTPVDQFPSGNGVAEFLAEADIHARTMWLAAGQKFLPWVIVGGGMLSLLLWTHRKL